MPKISEMIDSKYLKKSDLDDYEGEAVVTVVGVKRANIAREDQAEDLKWLIKFKEFEKPMVLNSTNIQLTARACGSEDTDDWKGKQIIVYIDENVSFGGKLVGGLRIKTLKRKAHTAASDSGWDEPEKPETAKIVADDIPF